MISEHNKFLGSRYSPQLSILKVSGHIVFSSRYVKLVGAVVLISDLVNVGSYFLNNLKSNRQPPRLGFQAENLFQGRQGHIVKFFYPLIYAF